ncbi:MAG: hypothetical protein KTR18_07280, partial [Acidiferrobacterales bacterium]|nr:hypothetical protein [Acidiferrobacterales bacterium]
MKIKYINKAGKEESAATGDNQRQIPLEMLNAMEAGGDEQVKRNINEYEVWNTASQITFCTQDAAKMATVPQQNGVDIKYPLDRVRKMSACMPLIFECRNALPMQCLTWTICA